MNVDNLLNDNSTLLVTKMSNYMFEVTVYNPLGIIKKIISAKVLRKRSDRIMLAIANGESGLKNRKRKKGYRIPGRNYNNRIYLAEETTYDESF